MEIEQEQYCRGANNASPDPIIRDIVQIEMEHQILYPQHKNGMLPYEIEREVVLVEEKEKPAKKARLMSGNIFSRLLGGQRDRNSYAQ